MSRRNSRAVHLRWLPFFWTKAAKDRNLFITNKLNRFSGFYVQSFDFLDESRESANFIYLFFIQSVAMVLGLGTRLALFTGMETGVDFTLRPIIAKARREANLPPAALPTLGAMINAYVDHVLDATSHNIARAARILDISRSTLYHYLRHHS